MDKKANTLMNFEDRYGIEEGKIRWDNYILKLKKKKKNRIKDLDMPTFLKKYDTHQRINVCDSVLMTKMFEYKELIKEDFDAPRILSQLNKHFFNLRSPQALDYWRERGWSEDQSHHLVKQQNDKQARNLEWYITKFGKIKGLEEYKIVCNNMSYKSRLVDKFGIQDGGELYMVYIEKRKGISTLPYYISLYGEEIGYKRYNEKIKKLKSVNYKQIIIDTHGIAYFESMQLKKSKTLKSQYATNPESKQFKGLLLNNKISKISMELFTDIVLQNPLFLSSSFGEFEKTIFVEDSQIESLKATKFHPDFCYNDKIIEFYGDYWHFNPKLYSSEQNNVKCKREYDLNRLNYLRSQGFQIHVVWEHDYKKNKIKILNECLEFLKR